MTKKRKRDSSAVMPEAVVAQPEPVRVIHIVDMRSPTWRMLCGVRWRWPDGRLDAT